MSPLSPQLRDRRARRRPCSVLLLWFLPLCAVALARAANVPTVDVLLWFDTEDYLLPADDDATKRLAELLTSRGIRATFKVVGEKARTLERRGRTDVIAALKQHAIGYHTNLHSVHPTPSEYLADAGWLDGIAEFVRREGPGAADVRRIFGVDALACYGQPGSSWGAQAIAALPLIGVAPHGVPCYVDEGSHVGLDEQPFWFVGALNVFHMGKNNTRMELHNPAALEPAQKKFSEIAEKLRAHGGGLISIYYHPCEWVHEKFWDAVNFSRGANPPREQWQPPPQRPAEQTDAAFERFGHYIDHMRSVPGVRFVTANELPTIYPDATRSGLREDDAHVLAGKIRTRTDGLDFVQLEARAFSVADQFELLAGALAAELAGEKPAYPRRLHGLLGPDAAPGAVSAATRLPWPAFRAALRDVVNFITTEKRIPSRVFIGPLPISPESFLVAMAEAADFRREQGRWPETEGLAVHGDVALLPARHVAKDTPQVFGGWIVHPENFRAPKILDLARLQAWTLKPALRNPSL